jgi:hypothetical protein
MFFFIYSQCINITINFMPPNPVLISNYFLSQFPQPKTTTNTLCVFVDLTGLNFSSSAYLFPAWEPWECYFLSLKDSSIYSLGFPPLLSPTPCLHSSSVTPRLKCHLLGAFLGIIRLNILFSFIIVPCLFSSWYKLSISYPKCLGPEVFLIFWLLQVLKIWNF